MSKYTVILVDLGKIVNELHFGSYSRYWWTFLNFSNYKNSTYFPIRLGQKTCTILNEHYFFITVQINEENCSIPQYYCECNNITSVASSSNTAISNLYKKIFKNTTRYLGPLVMGWNNKEIIQKLYENIKWIPFSIHVAIFVSRIENKTCKIEIYQDSKLSKIFKGTTPEEVWEKTGIIQKYNGNDLFGLANEKTQKILHNLKIPNCLCLAFISLCTNITLWSKEESEFQLWTRASDPIAEKTILENLYKLSFCINTLIHMPNTSQTFWSCFIEALAQNKKNTRWKMLINEHGIPLLSKPIISQIKFTLEKLDQFEKFFTSKDIVNISSYKSDHKGGLPILYLQDHKQMLWENFHEFYPASMKRTAFITRLQGSRYVYQDNLGGLCSEYNECGYEVFGEITALIKSNINDEIIWKELLANSQILCRYIQHNFSKQFQILPTGEAQHNSCISHCLRYAFGSCDFSHPDTCFNCEMIFSFFNKMKEYLSSELYEQLDGDVQVSLDELNNNGTVLIVDYKMKIVSQTARETKKDWYRKRGWTLHTVLVYTKNLNLNQLNVHAFDYWSDDTRQDA
ncbi:hypothetical protein Glove_159g45 [Diversispora epigaea]|uniref:Uncharacterized protein n=1 Tax=Diversispora epigaea TaxID=1348612 RepID=A0A397J132_9GLOM|nr:hypothetical protein Glove_159g45 [Diversispora epigaea]